MYGMPGKLPVRFGLQINGKKMSDEKLTPEAIKDLVEFVRAFATETCRCDEADNHDRACEILKKHGLKIMKADDAD